MVSVLALSAVDHGIEPGWVKQKTIKLVFVTFPLSMQYLGERAKTWLAENQDNLYELGRHVYPQTVVSVS